MTFQKLLVELPQLNAAEQAEVIRRLVELDESATDRVAESRAQELGRGAVQPKAQKDVFRNARAALK